MLPNQFSFLLLSWAWRLTTNHQQPVDFIDDLLDACRIRPHLDPWQTYLKVTRCKFSPIFTWYLFFFSSFFMSIQSIPLLALNQFIDWKLAHVCVCVYGFLQNCYLFICGCVLGCVDCDLSVRLLLWTVCLLCSAVCGCILSFCIHPSMCVCMYVL